MTPLAPLIWFIVSALVLLLVGVIAHYLITTFVPAPITMPLPGGLIRDRSAADWIAGYMAKREYFSQDRVENAVTHEEGRRIQIGDIVRVFCPQLQIADESRRVVAVTKGSGKQRITHERYDVSGYSPKGDIT